MRLIRKPERVEFAIQHSEHVYFKASGLPADVLPTLADWLRDHPAPPRPEPKQATGFTNS